MKIKKKAQKEKPKNEEKWNKSKLGRRNKQEK